MVLQPKKLNGSRKVKWQQKIVRKMVAKQEQRKKLAEK